MISTDISQDKNLSKITAEYKAYTKQKYEEGKKELYIASIQAKLEKLNAENAKLIPSLEIFPPVFQNMFIELADHFAVPLAFPVGYCIGLLGAILGRKRQLRYKNDWLVYPNFACVTVAPSGSGKSPLLDWLVLPIEKLQNEADARFEQAKKEYVKKMQEYRKDKDVLEPPIQPICEAVYMTDYTPEALAKKLKASHGYTTILVDELANLLLSIGKYTKTNGAERTALLSLLDGRGIKVDRATKDDIHISNALISIIGGIQPMTMPDVFTKADLARGLTQRFSFFLGDGDIRIESSTQPDITQNSKDLWNFCIETLAQLDFDSGDEPKIVNMSESAKAIVNVTIDELGSDKALVMNDDDNLFALYAKHGNKIPKCILVIYMMEILSLLFQKENVGNADKNFNGLVNGEIAKRGIDLAKWILRHQIEVIKRYDNGFKRKGILHDPLILALNSLEIKNAYQRNEKHERLIENAVLLNEVKANLPIKINDNSLVKQLAKKCEELHITKYRTGKSRYRIIPQDVFDKLMSELDI